MNHERILGESAPFGPRKIVGRPATPRQILWQLEQIQQFTDKHAYGPRISEQDYFPVRSCWPESLEPKLTLRLLEASR